MGSDVDGGRTRVAESPFPQWKEIDFEGGFQPSVVTSKPAIGGRVKTGQWEAVRD
jgi:hypothetical protein